jgi:hypothetical protein
VRRFGRSRVAGRTRADSKIGSIGYKSLSINARKGEAAVAWKPCFDRPVAPSALKANYLLGRTATMHSHESCGASCRLYPQA